MKNVSWLCIVSVIFNVHLPAQERRAESRVDRVGLFKNGLAVVTRQVDLGEAGSYLLQNVPEPVHGTYWIESEVPVEVRVAVRQVGETAGEVGAASYQQLFAGQKITVYFRDPDMAAVSGTVAIMDAPDTTKQWSRAYDRDPFRFNRRNASPSPANTPTYLTLKTQDGFEFILEELIARIHSETAPHKQPVSQSVLILDTPKSQASVKISYLTKGLSWAPSYRLNLGENNQVSITQKAVLKNEWEDFTDTEVYLISGFPNIEFSQVLSPLSLNQQWASFFSQLNAPSNGSGSASTMNQLLVNSRSSSSPDSSFEILETNDIDIYYHPIGKKSLKEGESLLIPIDTAVTDYTPIIEWIIPDIRTANGNLISEHERKRYPEKYEDVAWDALKFNNPFDFPMTTAAALIVQGDKFLGQKTSYWVNQGEQTTLKITKALSLKTRKTEVEVPDSRETVRILRNDYTKSTVEGTLEMKNLRSKPQEIVVRMKISGELERMSGSPDTRLLEEGVWSVNKRNEITWNLTLQAGEEKSLTYRYTVLAD